MRSERYLATLGTVAFSLLVLSGCGNSVPLSTGPAGNSIAAVAETSLQTPERTGSEAAAPGKTQSNSPSGSRGQGLTGISNIGSAPKSTNTSTARNSDTQTNSSTASSVSAPSTPENNNSTIVNTGNGTTGGTGANQSRHENTKKTTSSPVPKYPQHATQQISPEVWTVPAGDVAITIDDGPSPYTLKIIHVLEKYHVHATFFFVGSRVKYWPNAVKAAVAAGDEIGDHTETHPLLTSLSPADQEQQIVGAAKEIQQYDPLPITLFRPPYEGFNNATERILVQNHMALALWNRDPRDWAAKTPQQIVNAVVHGNPSGGVFDMHDKLLTLEALPTIIQDLQKLGLHFVILQAPTGSTGIATNSGHP